MAAGARRLAEGSGARGSSAPASSGNGDLFGSAEKVCRRCSTALTSPSLGSVWGRSMTNCNTFVCYPLLFAQDSVNWVAARRLSWKRVQAPPLFAANVSQACRGVALAGVLERAQARLPGIDV